MFVDADGRPAGYLLLDVVDGAAHVEQVSVHPMRATVAALQEELGAGGNRWVLAGLWLGLWHRQVGDEAGLQPALTYALNAQTNLGPLPEQVTNEGEPAWVVPLAWSHAMLLLAARLELSWR